MGAITLIAAAVLYGLCFYMSYKAADIFNQVVTKRQLFPGTVTVERLTATPGGTVSFEGAWYGTMKMGIRWSRYRKASLRSN